MGPLKKKNGIILTYLGENKKDSPFLMIEMDFSLESDYEIETSLKRFLIRIDNLDTSFSYDTNYEKFIVCETFYINKMTYIIFSNTNNLNCNIKINFSRISSDAENMISNIIVMGF